MIQGLAIVKVNDNQLILSKKDTRRSFKKIESKI